ncbi:(R)-mandelonitrile lyase 3-like [Benincasa hispida]|uniref:(R)-mandelonitrile lyase 3-like n=1 Tax=Benincasa hispida TaxID=102211 RepID=UPI001900E93C|nr:(R)-mandelonitrile lyase 3-like [Benincasa hispida]
MDFYNCLYNLYYIFDSILCLYKHQWLQKQLYRRSENCSTMAAFLLLILVFLTHSQLGLNQDVSYMKFVRNASEFPEKEEYDYIIVGGGTTGCPLAATLSKNFSTLLIERGSEPSKYPSVLNEQELLNVFTVEDDGKNPFNRFISEDGVENIRGRILGGTSMINGGVYSRANPEFFKTQLGMQELDMEMVEKAYQWVEEAIVYKPSLNLWQAAFRRFLVEGGVQPDNGFDLRDIVGTKISGSIFDENGIRHGAVELLNKAKPTNLKVAVQATVQRILFSGLSARGVLYSDSKGKLHTAFIREKGEIILSAGALGSPQLLLLSGVGPKSYLSSLKLRVVLNQPHVGQFMSDNPRFGIILALSFRLAFSSSKVIGISQNNSYYFQSIASTTPLSIPPLFSIFPPNSTSLTTTSLATIGGKFSKISSFGSLHLNSSTDVKNNPIVRFNYYSHPDDLAKCVRGVRKVGDFLKTPTIENIKTRDLEGNKTLQFVGLPLPENLSDDTLVGEFCKKTVTSYWHYHGGCLVGKVVDSNYSVIGIKNLRVLDGSTFAVSPGSNPTATLMMLARYVGLRMLQQRGV